MMTTQRLLKRIHILGTAWFTCCAAALLVISLRQAGFRWWVIFSISGYSAVLFAFLLTFYLFALYRGVARAQYAQEHPLSTSPAYLFFYDSAPFWGAVAGLFCSFDIPDWTLSARMVAEGTLGMTFMTWVILDSVVGGVESILPKSVRHRTERIAKANAEKERIQRENAALLASLEQSEKILRGQWEAAFRDIAAELAGLYCGGKGEPGLARQRTAEAGAKAWRTGKIACMRFVHQMIREEMSRHPSGHCVDYAAVWWDGIGSWRRPEELATSLLICQSL
ncbi:MAG: hypothetical protein GXY41_02355 [Phycisphaerae bacterium]|nr:hypothetical protein [Phycisphaerae bacterium]